MPLCPVSRGVTGVGARPAHSGGRGAWSQGKDSKVRWPEHVRAGWKIAFCLLPTDVSNFYPYLSHPVAQGLPLELGAGVRGGLGVDFWNKLEVQVTHISLKIYVFVCAPAYLNPPQSLLPSPFVLCLEKWSPDALRCIQMHSILANGLLQFTRLGS